jgi:large subunit ribosomal protein L21
MYAVIEAGGKQERVEVGQRVDVELLRARPGEEVSFRPVLVVDGETVLATPDGLQDATVAGRVVGEKLGPKIDGFTYKNKTRSRRRFGHRQRYTTVEISSIDSEAYSLHASIDSLLSAAEEAVEAAEAESVTDAGTEAMTADAAKGTAPAEALSAAAEADEAAEVTAEADEAAGDAHESEESDDAGSAESAED